MIRWNIKSLPTHYKSSIYKSNFRWNFADTSRTVMCKMHLCDTHLNLLKLIYRNNYLLLYRMFTKHSLMKRTRKSIYLSDQRLMTRARPMTKCYASLIAITRFHIAIKRVYIHLFPCTNNNAIRGSLLLSGTYCVNRTLKERDAYGALTQNSHDRSFFRISFYGNRNGIF